MATQDAVVVDHEIDIHKRHYVVTCSISDAGNRAAEASRIVMVGDTGSPIIKLIGDSFVVMEVVLNILTMALLLKIVLMDLTGKITVTSNVDAFKAGTYYVKYDVKMLRVMLLYRL